MRLSSNLKMVLLTLLTILLVLVILIIFIVNRPSFSVFPWYLNFGFIISLALIAAFAIKWVIPWKKSAEGEEEVYKQLIRLPKEYLFMADFHKSKKENVDFVVIGPTGIYAIESKNTIKGVVALENDNIYINGSIFNDKDPLKQAYEESIQIHEYLKESHALSLSVTPVLVFANPGVEMTFCKEKKHGVFVAGVNCLNDVIQNAPRDGKFTPEFCNKIKKDLNTHCSDIV